MSKSDILLITKGHPFEKGPFFSLFDQLNVNYTHIEQPLASQVMSLEIAQQYDCLVFFDMPGIEFLPGGPIVSDPPDSFRAEFQLMLEAGIGMVFLHHAIAGWPHWREYHQTIGGQFLYTQQTTETRNLMDSGYRHGVDHQITVANPAHPVAFNVPPHFSMTDELYLYEVYEHELEPLLVSDYSFDQTQFFSAAAVVERGEMFSNDGWSHPPGSALVGWTRKQNNSRICYLQGGDNASAWDNPHYRTLLDNAIRWTSGSL